MEITFWSRSEKRGDASGAGPEEERRDRSALVAALQQELAHANRVAWRLHRLRSHLLSRAALGEGVAPPPALRHAPLHAQEGALLGTLREVAKERGKSVPQVAINWCMSKGAVVIVGVKSAAQAEENLGALGWELSGAECAELEASVEAMGTGAAAPSRLGASARRSDASADRTSADSMDARLVDAGSRAAGLLERAEAMRREMREVSEASRGERGAGDAGA